MYGEAIGSLVKLFFIAIPFSVLGMWKLIEILIWLFQHVNINIA